MIYEFRTYDIKPRTVDQFGENTKAKLDKRLEYSSLGGFWYTEMGPLNQVVHIWPYEDLNHRSEIRSKAVSDGDWPPDNNDIILNMESEIMLPAPFMRPLEPKREEYSPLVGCWYSDIGGLNKFIHMWSYDSFEERASVRAETRAQGVWPPKGGVAPVKQENKILLPFDFSPLQ